MVKVDFFGLGFRFSRRFICQRLVSAAQPTLKSETGLDFTRFYVFVLCFVF